MKHFVVVNVGSVLESLKLEVLFEEISLLRNGNVYTISTFNTSDSPSLNLESIFY